jgi:hypothetical protein
VSNLLLGPDLAGAYVGLAVVRPQTEWPLDCAWDEVVVVRSAHDCGYLFLYPAAARVDDFAGASGERSLRTYHAETCREGPDAGWIVTVTCWKLAPAGENGVR